MNLSKIIMSICTSYARISKDAESALSMVYVKMGSLKYASMGMLKKVGNASKILRFRDLQTLSSK